ncbi:hypothetical protein D3C87_1431760 [compost metagenome]
MHHAIDFRKTNYFFIRDVSHGSVAIDWQEVMFTERQAADFLHHDHLIVVHFVFNDSHLRKLFRIQSAENFVHIHFSDAVRRVAQTVIVKIQP